MLKATYPDQQKMPNIVKVEPTLKRLRLSRLLMLIGGGGMLLSIVAIVIGSLFDKSSIFFPVLFPPLPHHQALSPVFVIIVVAIFVVLMLLYCGILFGVMYFKARQHLTVTEHSLIMFGFRKVHSVSWQEAKLFAIDGLFGAKRYPHPTLFELSSANDIVRWTWMRRSSFRVMFYARPMLSEEDYNRQMQSLLSFIVARTGLPLCDLRDRPKH